MILSLRQAAMLLIHTGCMLESVNGAVAGPPPPPAGGPPSLAVPVRAAGGRAGGPPPPGLPPPNLTLGSGAVRRPAPAAPTGPTSRDPTPTRPRPQNANGGGLVPDADTLLNALAKLRSRAPSGGAAGRRRGNSAVQRLRTEQVDALVRQASGGGSRFAATQYSSSVSGHSSEWDESSESDGQ